jgi:Domain of unknown function (DUF4388)
MQSGNDRTKSGNLTEAAKSQAADERALRNHEEQEATMPMAVPTANQTFVFDEQIFNHLEEVVSNGQMFDGIVIDLMQMGFAIRLDLMVKLTQYAERLLTEKGVLLLIKADGAITLVKEEPGRGLTYTFFNSPLDIFVRYPRLAEHVYQTVPGMEQQRLSTGSPLASHILHTSIPVLTPKGQRAKHEMPELPPKLQWLLQQVDDYTAMEAISWRMQQSYNVPADETLRIVQECEREKLIYPLLARLQFLANCYRKQLTFRLGRYMVAAGVLTESQLKDLLEQQAEQGHGRAEKMYLGLLAIKAGYINTRELEILLADQYLYGGYKHISGEGAVGALKYVETMRDSMLGTLGAIETPGLMQSLASAQKTGILSIEDRGKAAIIAFKGGKITHAKLGKMLGPNAVLEIVVSWKEGIFIFRDQGTSDDLDETCAVSSSLDRLLMDGALAEDQINQIYSMLPNGKNTVLELAFNFEAAWNSIIKTQLKYFDQTPVGPRDLQMLFKLAGSFDGLSAVNEVRHHLEEFPIHLVIKGAYLLLETGLVTIQQGSFFRVLSLFQTIVTQMGQHLAPPDNLTLLKKSLYYVHGDSSAASRFKINEQTARISIDLNEVKRSGIPVSTIIADLKKWMQAYTAYCKKMVGPAPVDTIVNAALSVHPEQR